MFWKMVNYLEHYQWRRIGHYLKSENSWSWKKILTILYLYRMVKWWECKDEYHDFNMKSQDPSIPNNWHVKPYLQRIIVISFIVFCRWGNDKNIQCVAKTVSDLLPLKLGNARYLWFRNIKWINNPHYKRHSPNVMDFLFCNLQYFFRCYYSRNYSSPFMTILYLYFLPKRWSVYTLLVYVFFNFLCMCVFLVFYSVWFNTWLTFKYCKEIYEKNM